MKNYLCLIAFAYASPAGADTVYSRLRDIAIPAGFNGVYLDVDAGSTFAGTSLGAPAGWDINFFFGGAGIANSPAFQPARSGTANLDAIVKFQAGTLVSEFLNYSSGFGGSGDDHQHIGTAVTQFQPDQEGYLGFEFTRNGSASTLHGWMRVVLNYGGMAGPVIRDWAYDDSGGSINIGRIHQSAPAAGQQQVTLSPGSGESFSLGSAITDSDVGIGSLLKIGSGTTILSTANSYSGRTSIMGGSLALGSSAALPSAAPMTLSNAMLETRGFSASTGPFSLSTGVIDFGTLATSSLTFSDTNTWSGVLSIWNWTGTANTAGDTGTDRLVFLANTGLGAGARDLGEVRFFSDSGQTLLGEGRSVLVGDEVVPVPEPADLAVGALLSLALLRHGILRRRKAAV